MTLLTDRDLLERLVKFDTTSHRSTLPLADFICDYLDRPGVRIDRNPSPDGSKANLIVRLGPETPDRRGLVLSGHMDTVPATEPGWSSDPYNLTERDGRLFGRGSSDMKGFLALAVNRAASLLETPLASPLVLILTYDEEVGTLGSRHFVESWPELNTLPSRAVIGEPTSLRAVRMHKGHVKLRLTFEGESAHSGYPHLGRNAIEPAGRAIIALARLREALAAERPALHERFGVVPFVTLNVASVHGGLAVNVVPDRCVLDVGFRPLPRMEPGTIVERIRTAVATALGEVPFSLEMTGESPSMIGAPTEVYQHLCETVEQTGEATVSYTTDGGWFQRAGMECVIFGPGSIEVAHKPDEYLPADQFARAGGILDDLIHSRCVTPAPES